MDYRGRSRRRAVARFAIGGLAGALLLVLGFAPAAFAAPVSHFAINSVGLTEGNAGTTNLTFTISYTGTKNNISVDWATADGTATAPADYTASSGTATFTLAGAMSQTISIPVAGDLLDEANETFTVNLTNPQPPATADITTGTGTATNHGQRPDAVARHQRCLAHRRQPGTANADVRRDALGAERPGVTVNYATANSTAVQPGDYTTGPGRSRSPPARSCRPSPSRSRRPHDETNETYFVNLSGDERNDRRHARDRHHRQRRLAAVISINDAR